MLAGVKRGASLSVLPLFLTRLSCLVRLQSKAARSARGLRNRLMNRSKEEHAPRAAAAWSAIETHTHRVSEMYIALAEVSDKSPAH